MDAAVSSIDKLRERLVELGRKEMAHVIHRHWNTPLGDYAEKLWEGPLNRPHIEPELTEAFLEEFRRVGYPADDTRRWMDSLETTRVLQTATHLTATEGPTFLAIHHLALMGMPAEKTYLVGSYSAIPFANAAWSGCLNLNPRFPLEAVVEENAPGFAELRRADLNREQDSGERRVSLIPGNLREARVYRNLIPEKLERLLPFLKPSLLQCVPDAQTGNSFTAWASRFCREQMRLLYPQYSIVYFDLNEVIRAYLLRVLAQSTHPVSRTLLEPGKREKVLDVFGIETPIFTIPLRTKNRERSVPVYIHGDRIVAQNYSIPLNAETLSAALENGTLCPGLFLTFTILSFINGLTCIGSFEQIEYLSRFQTQWLQLNLLDQDVVSKVNPRAFCCGRRVDVSGETVHPLDLLLGWSPEFPELKTLGDLLQPLLPRLGVSI